MENSSAIGNDKLDDCEHQCLLNAASGPPFDVFDEDVVGGVVLRTLIKGRTTSE
jgi:hypothetical protein